jgi:hypothetical protein
MKYSFDRCHEAIRSKRAAIPVTRDRFLVLGFSLSVK